MRPMSSKAVRRAAFLAVLLLLAAPAAVQAHCDTLDGPVVTAARRALEAGDPNPVLVWVQAKDDAEIRAAFQQTLAVRKQGGEAERLADTWFFETLVRVHRAGEGAPYTGLKPAGLDLGPAIPAADRAIETGSPAALEAMLVEAVKHGLEARFQPVVASRKHAPSDLAAGREHVAAYVEYVHWVEAVHQAATSGGAHHEGEAAPEGAAHGHERGHP